jgi:hypothetical protein
MPDRPARILLVDDEQPIQTLLSFPAAARRLRGGAGVRRPRGARPLRRAGLRPRGPRRDAPADGRPRGLPPPARALLGADHHAHREVRGDRQGARASSSGRTTTSPSRSPCASSARASRRRCGARACGRPTRTRTTRSRRSSCASIRPSARSTSVARACRPPTSSSRSSPPSRATRDACTRATCCSHASGETRRIATRARSTSTSATCARSSSATPRSPSTSSRSAAWATASATARRAARPLRSLRNRLR